MKIETVKLPCGKVVNATDAHKYQKPEPKLKAEPKEEQEMPKQSKGGKKKTYPKKGK
jgi:hypothetical protein